MNSEQAEGPREKRQGRIQTRRMTVYVTSDDSVFHDAKAAREHERDVVLARTLLRVEGIDTTLAARAIAAITAERRLLVVLAPGRGDA
jgi:hypothetical protein